MGASSVGAAFGVVVLVLILAIFVVGVWLLARFLRWLARRLFRPIDDLLAKLIAALFAGLIVPDVLFYFVNVAVSLISFIPRAMATLLAAAAVATPPCTTDCTRQAVGQFLLMLSQLLSLLVGILHLEEFPTRQFVFFVLVAVGLYLAYTWFRSQRTTARGAALGAATRPVIIHLFFFALVISAFYLCLTALLAISLQSRSTADGFTPDDLDKAISADLPLKEAFDLAYPASAVAIVVDPGLDPERKSIATHLSDRAAELGDRATSARDSSYNELTSMKATALSEFRNQNAERAGGRETIEHFGIVLSWYQNERHDRESALTQCLRTAASVIRRTKSAIDGFHSPLGPSNEPGLSKATLSDLADIDAGFDNAASVCEGALILDHNKIQPRPQHGFDLGFIGQSTNWLLGTESLPLAILIGLVGFSILGATMSRIVRIGIDRGLSGVGLEDLLVVVAAGSAAAMVVFLASYGGLAVVSDTTTDPNPYVVFAACFIGAVFSEDVWQWARGRILGGVVIGPATAANGNGDAGAIDTTTTGATTGQT